jgi:iron complex transport system substrate-binding protein
MSRRHPNLGPGRNLARAHRPGAGGRLRTQGGAATVLFARAAWAAVLLLAAPAAAAAPIRLGPPPPKQVRRVVTLAPSLTATVLALGAKDRLVGVSRFDTAPEVSKLPRVGGFVDPSVEAVLALEPDLLLVQPAPGNQRPVETLARLGIPVLAVPLHTADEALGAIGAVAEALGLPAEGKQLVGSIQAVREHIRAGASARPRRRVLIAYDFEPLVVAGPGSFPDELLRDCGAHNALERADSPFPVLPLEVAVATLPEVVIDAAHSPQGAERVRALPGFKDARWVKLASPALMQPGPDLARGLEELLRLVYPEEPGEPRR